jgi:hypothetical protein
LILQQPISIAINVDTLNANTVVTKFYEGNIICRLYKINVSFLFFAGSILFIEFIICINVLGVSNSLKNKLEPEVIAERVESLSSLADEMVSERARMRIGQRVRVLIEDAELQEGRAAHQGPEVDGTTAFIGTNFKVGEYVDAVVIESIGADLVAEAE